MNKNCETCAQSDGIGRCKPEGHPLCESPDFHKWIAKKEVKTVVPENTQNIWLVCDLKDNKIIEACLTREEARGKVKWCKSQYKIVDMACQYKIIKKVVTL